MNRGGKTTTVRAGAHETVLNAAWVADLLNERAGIHWPSPGRLSDVRIERAWPMRNGDTAVEWSARLGGVAESPSGRYSIYASHTALGLDASDESLTTPVIDERMIRNLRVDLPDLHVQIHSLDRDSRMPHLKGCLDASEMAKHLQAIWNGAATRPKPARLTCRLLAYRARRRAAIAYRRFDETAAHQTLMGKTFRGDRAKALLDVHEAVARELVANGCNNVCVPASVGLIESQRMALFSWVQGASLDFAPASLSCAFCAERTTVRVTAAIDALAALHRVSLPGLPAYSVSDECAIVDRWRAALVDMSPSGAACVFMLAEALRSVGESVRSTRQCTIHRDFYDKQLLQGQSGTTILDLDTLSRGHPAVDLGNYLAHVYLCSLQSDWPKQAFPETAQAALRRYDERTATLHDDALPFCFASALFRVGAVHATRTETRRFAPALWQLARDVLAYAGSRAVVSDVVIGWCGCTPSPERILGANQ